MMWGGVSKLSLALLCDIRHHSSQRILILPLGSRTEKSASFPLNFPVTVNTSLQGGPEVGVEEHLAEVLL